MEDEPHDSLFLRRRGGSSSHTTTEDDKAAEEYGLTVALNDSHGESDAVGSLHDTGVHSATGGVDSVSCAVENGENDEDEFSERHISLSSTGAQSPVVALEEVGIWNWKRLLLTPLLPDDRFMLLGLPLVDGVKAVRLLKFTAFTWIGLVLMFAVVRIMVSSTFFFGGVLFQF